MHLKKKFENSSREIYFNKKIKKEEYKIDFHF